MRIENPEAIAHTRIGWLRAVNNIQHAFAAQSFIAEIAQAQGKDHRDYLLELLGPDRLHRSTQDQRAVEPRRIAGALPDQHRAAAQGDRDGATQEAGWGRKLPSRPGPRARRALQLRHLHGGGGRGRRSAPNGELTIPRVDIAVDCGPQINPDRVRSQIEGACVMGLSQAVVSEITFKNGRAQQDNFHQYEIVRMNTAPKRIVVHIIPSDSYDMPLGGVGEPGVPVIAPALMNAIQARPESASAACRCATSCPSDSA